MKMNILLEVPKQELHGVQVGLGKLLDQLLHRLHLLPRILGFCTREEQVHAQHFILVHQLCVEK